MGLPAKLKERTRNILSKCDEFNNDDRLRAFFSNTAELSCYHDSVKEAKSKKERIEMCLELLLPFRFDGKPLLSVFLFALHNNYGEGDERRNKLKILAESVLSIHSSPSMSPPNIAFDQSDQQSYNIKKKKQLVDELGEWKLVHNESQTLLNALNIPFDYLTAYRFDYLTADYLTAYHLYSLEQADLKWQTCVRKLRSVPEKWNLQYAYASDLDDLRAKTSNLNDITKMLAQTEDIEKPEFKYVYSQIGELKDILWDVLTVADKKIMLLIETLKTVIGE